MTPARRPRQFPIELGLRDLQSLIPHRGDILFVRRVKVLSNAHFIGEACWPAQMQILQGHFPGMPLVPGVFLIEAVAQVAGAGMLVGDDRAELDADHVGVLAGVRKCTFRRAVAVDVPVRIDTRSRQMSPQAAAVSATVSDAQGELAQMEVLIVKAPRGQLLQAQPPANGAD